MTKGIRRLLKIAKRNTEKDIAEHAVGGFFAARVPSEGYAAGYRDALEDVLLALNGVRPQRRGYWGNEDCP